MDELQLKLLWSNLFGLRLILTILPQYGFISTEEFGSPNAMAGILGLSEGTDILQSDGRSMLLPALTSGVPFLFLRMINNIGIFGNVITPYLVLISPRIWMTFCSIVIDIFVYKLSTSCGCNTKTALSSMTLFASSYVTWIYFTRTLSASLETIIFTGIIYAAKCATTFKQGNIVGKKTYMDCIEESALMASLSLLGTCVNEKFITFAILPVSYWVLFPYSSVSQCFLKNLLFSLIFILGSLMFSLLENILYDFDILIELLNNFDTTGLAAFILRLKVELPEVLYIKPTNIKLIPQNILQTCFLLLTTYGPAAILLFKSFFKLNYFKDILDKQIKCDDTILFYTTLGSIFLKIFCTNSPQFQIHTVIVPIIILVAQNAKSVKMFFLIHCVFNLSGFMYYAVFKYGGATHSMEFLGHLSRTVTHVNSMEVVLYKTPLLPQYLTALPSVKCENNVEGLCHGTNHANIHFTEVTSETIQKTLDHFLIHNPESMTVIVLPSCISCQLIMKLRMMYDLQLYYKYFPHVIDIQDIPDYTNMQEWCNFKGDQINSLSRLLEEKFTLNILGVSRPMHKQSEIVEKTKKLVSYTNIYSSSI